MSGLWHKADLATTFGTMARKLNLMEYRGVRYTIRAGIERGRWFVVIHPDEVEVPSNKVFGAREDAEFHARRNNKWLEPSSGHRESDRPT
jgi:hypothetical protein